MYIIKIYNDDGEYKIWEDVNINLNKIIDI